MGFGVWGLGCRACHLVRPSTRAEAEPSLGVQRGAEAAAASAWKAEATFLLSLQFFASVQPGNVFVIMGHTLSTIYLTNTDVAPISRGVDVA